ncbi:MAG: zf-HC2 domain-containing protein [Candidatus Dormiibacterota bacterium]
MSALDCERWRGDLAMAAVGRLDGSERRAVTAHLDGCPGCRSELAELEATTSSLALADPARVEPRPGAVPSREAGARTPAWRLDRARWALGGVGLVAIAAASLFWLSGASTSPITVSLHGSQRARATAVLSAERYGTDVSLLVAGQTPGAVYHVSMESRSGTWWQAGSYRATRGPEHVELACGIAPNKVDQIWIENSHGEVVLQAPVS